LKNLHDGFDDLDELYYIIGCICVKSMDSDDSVTREGGLKIEHIAKCKVCWRGSIKPVRCSA